MMKSMNERITVATAESEPTTVIKTFRIAETQQPRTSKNNFNSFIYLPVMMLEPIVRF